MHPVAFTYNRQSRCSHGPHGQDKQRSNVEKPLGGDSCEVYIKFTASRYYMHRQKGMQQGSSTIALTYCIWDFVELSGSLGNCKLIITFKSKRTTTTKNIMLKVRAGPTMGPGGSNCPRRNFKRGCKVLCAGVLLPAHISQGCRRCPLFIGRLCGLGAA